MFHTPERNRAGQRGFAHIPLLIAVALGAVLVAAFVAGSRSSSDSAADKAAKANASAVIQTGQNLKAAVDQLMIEGYTADAIEFNNCGTGTTPCSVTGGVGLWHPSDGTAVEPTYPDNAVLKTENPDWHMHDDTQLNGVGLDGTAEHVAYLHFMTDGVCERVNSILHGTESIPTTSGTLAAADANDDLQASPSNVDFTSSGDGIASGWRMGCVNDSNGNNVFFAALNED